ncbi:phage tail protein [Escherichia coli]|nr:phage tail protein [Escherichia coli]MCZ7345617.1 phage tail protein [Escherichia coli]
MPVTRYLCIFINVGLGEGAPAIGVPFFWPSAAMPNTVIDSWSSMVFLKFNGAKFSATDYPVLAKVFPSLVLPEARGDFIRIWDDGRGVDSGRALLSAQGDGTRTQTGTLWTRQFKVVGDSGNTSAAVQNPSGVFSIDNNAATSGWDYIENTRSGSPSGANRINLNIGNAVETRPRNITFNFLVRAK